MTRNRSLVILGTLGFAVIGVLVWFLLQEEEYQRIQSPEGSYTAIVTYRKYQAFMPTFPGQSGDKAGFIRIVDKSDRNYGRIPIPMVSMARDLEWTQTGAKLKLVGAWNFSKNEYRYWNDAQTEEIVKYAQ